MKFIFRVDANQRIGSGHFMRCLSLANELRDRGAKTCFVSLDLPEHLLLTAKEQGHEVRFLEPQVIGNERADAQATLVGESEITACIVDHYELGLDWEAILIPLTKVLAVDDLGRPHVAHWVLDPNHYEHPECRYKNSTPAEVKRLLGPSFALLRKEFIEARSSARIRCGIVRNVVVFMGGMDSANFTATALEAVSQGLKSDVHVTVIAGASHPDLHGLQDWCKRRGTAKLHVQVSNMSFHLLSADLAIGAGGANTLERCACGLPSVAICLAENQREVIEEGTRTGFLWGFDHVPTAEELAVVLRALAGAPGMIQRMSRYALHITDARGAQRVGDELMPRKMTVRRATQDDARMIYVWRTSKDILKFSRNIKSFSFELHVEWLTKILKDSSRLLLVGVHEVSDIGVVRFDIDGREAEVSIFLAPHAIGQRLGRELLLSAEAELRKVHPNIITLNAWVNEDNKRSFQLFQSLGYINRISKLNKELA